VGGTATVDRPLSLSGDDDPYPGSLRHCGTYGSEQHSGESAAAVLPTTISCADSDAAITGSAPPA
jgi:hypothetical protein